MPDPDKEIASDDLRSVHTESAEDSDSSHNDDQDDPDSKDSAESDGEEIHRKTNPSGMCELGRITLVTVNPNTDRAGE